MLANPASVSRFRTEDTQLAANSIIVANAAETKFRVIPQTELYDYEIDYQTQTYKKYDFLGEQAVTAAIIYVTSQDTPVIYFLQGHDELPLSQLHHVTDALRARNYEPRELHLSNTDAVVREGDVVVAVAPSQDLSETEYESLKAFLAEGGRLYYASNYVSGALPYFDMLLSLYGLEVDKGLLVEDCLLYTSSGQMMVCLPVRGDEPLCPAMIWADGRARKEADELEKAFPPGEFYRRVGMRPSPNHSLPKWKRFRQLCPCLLYTS